MFCSTKAIKFAVLFSYGTDQNKELNDVQFKNVNYEHISDFTLELF